MVKITAGYIISLVKSNLRRTLIALGAIIILWGLFAWSINSTNQLSTKINEKKQKESPQLLASPSPSPQIPPFEELIVKKQNIEIQVKYEDNNFKYQGLVKLNTPCDTIKTETQVLESYPEQVQIKITSQKSKEICAQVITEKEFSGQVEAPQTSIVQIYYNGRIIN